MIFYIMQTQTQKRNPERFTQCAEINRRKFPNCLQEISGLSQNSAVHARAIRFLQRQIRYLMRKPDYSVPYTYMKYTVKTKGDEDKVSQALAKMTAEDVTLKSVNDSENRQTLLVRNGRSASSILSASKLAARYKVEITLETPKVAFRETIRKNSDVDSEI